VSIRLNTTLDLIAGLDNSLDKKIFGGTSVLSEVVDSLEHGKSCTLKLDGGETDVAVPLGDISDVRFVYIEADAEFNVAFAAPAATAAQITGVGGTYPTTFAGGETLSFDIDGSTIAIVFDAADQTLDQVIARINFEAALQHAAFVSVPVAFDNGSQLQLKSPTTGLTSTVAVAAGGTALATLGLTGDTTATGAATVPGTSDIKVVRPADTAGASAAEGVKAYLMGTVQATALTVSNPNAASAVNLEIFVAGDLVAAP
jgi:hypothetical protein